jgi:hypothetical protein
MTPGDFPRIGYRSRRGRAAPETAHPTHQPRKQQRDVLAGTAKKRECRGDDGKYRLDDETG